MEKLLKGAFQFRQNTFGTYKELFRNLANKQNPEALFICCSDSRVVPNLITMTDPGDLFTYRNIGNIIPPYEEFAPNNTEATVLEFALESLQLRNIVLCGHSNCGAVRAAIHSDLSKHSQLNPTKNPSPVVVDSTPHIRAWLRHIEPAKQLLQLHEPFQTEEQRESMLSQLNVLIQVKHLKTYPGIKERLERGQLSLYAWFFEIKHARLLVYRQDEENFLPIDSKEPVPLQ